VVGLEHLDSELLEKDPRIYTDSLHQFFEDLEAEQWYEYEFPSFLTFVIYYQNKKMPPKLKKPSKKLTKVFYPIPELQDVKIKKKKGIVRQYFVPSHLVAGKQVAAYWVKSYPRK
jgi:hypothetical protein